MDGHGFVAPSTINYPDESIRRFDVYMFSVVDPHEE